MIKPAQAPASPKVRTANFQPPGTQRLPTHKARVVRGVVRNRAYEAEIRLDSLVSRRFAVLETLHGGAMRERPMAFKRPERNGTIILTAPILDGPPVASAHVVVKTGGGALHSIEFDPTTYDLDRLLSLTPTAVEQNLRWRYKIGDRETLMFACAQSFALAPSVPVGLRCLLPYAYQAMETADGTAIEKAHAMAEQVRAEVVAMADVEIGISFETLEWHLALFGGDRVAFEGALRRIFDYAGMAKEAPLSTYNAVKGCLMFGYVLMRSGRAEQAQTAFWRCNDLLQIATPRFAGRALNLYKELLAIHHASFHAMVGLNQILGKRLGSNRPVDTYSVVKHATRLADPAANRRLVANLDALYPST